MTGGLYAVSMARGDTPRYRQIAADLSARIETGEFPPGSMLPAERSLQAYYGAAQATVRHAIDVLRIAGLVQPEHGVGVHVRKPPEPGPSQYDVVMERLSDLDERVRRLEGLRAGERDRQP
jgi:DNA-binding GntR family transcriptional regulator